MFRPQNKSIRRLLLAGWVTAALSGAAPAGIDDPSVRFLKPRHNSTVVGSSTIRLFVSVPEQATVLGVEIRIDGRRFTELLAPPWEVSWDAGDGGRAHRLEAIVRLSDGRETRSAIRTSPLTVNQVEKVDLVNLYLVVRDLGGGYISDLTRDDFRILENDVPQRIERFTATHKPLRVGIVLDTSGTMGKGKVEPLEHAKKAALEFLDILRPGDEATVVTFSDFVHLSGEFSDSKEELARPIREAHAQGGTALYDAIWKTSRLLEDFTGRRVMVLLSDGRDESYEGLEPGSLHTLKEAMDQALRSEVMIFPIGLGKNLDKEWIRRWGSLGGRSNLDTTTSVADVLHDLAESTGGRAIMADESKNLRRAFNEIADDLRHQYSLAYDSTDPSRDGKWRSLEVTVPGRRLEVVTRTGYYAPKASRKERRLSAR